MFSIHISSKVLVANQASSERLFTVVRSGSFGSGNTAASMGLRDLDSLRLQFVPRVSAVLSLNGLESRELGQAQ